MRDSLLKTSEKCDNAFAKLKQAKEDYKIGKPDAKTALVKAYDNAQ